MLYKLEKHLKLYRQQYETYMQQLFGSPVIDRASMDLDAIMFRIKYMKKHKKDLDKLPELEDKFEQQTLVVRDAFTKLIYHFLTDIIGPGEINDIFMSNVGIDQNYIDFDLQIISFNIGYLNFIDGEIKDNEAYNIFPDKYFRFYTDSYNDGIEKAYPELFETREQNVVGTGDDKDVFVHSMTIQSGERCSLSCSYCLGPDAKILMADGTEKPIKDIQIGDEVLSVDENIIYNENAKNNEWYYNEDRITPTKVTKVITHNDTMMAYAWRYYDGIYEDEDGNECVDEADCTWITPNHPCLTPDRTFEPFEDIIKKDLSGFVMYHPDWIMDSVFPYELIIPGYVKEGTVYNLETESHTYIADRLIVHNCYQFDKSEMKMSFDTAKEFIDHLLNDDYGYINRYNSPAIILEFIGGEPLLEINLTRKVYEYFLDRCYELNHPWFTMHRLSICSNGMQYFDNEVQAFFKEYSSQISFNISIDGNKKLHDACRIQPNGEGSYDIDMMALSHYNKHYSAERNSKMTLAPSNISYLFDSVVDFIEHGMTVININCVFEEGWEPKHANIEYEQLKKLADYILKNNLEHIYVAIFNDKQEDMMDKNNDRPFCGGASGSMLSMRPNGEFYPCIRYMPTSVGLNRRNMNMGNVNDGMVGREDDSEVIKDLDTTTRRSYNTDICFECPLSNDCAGCGALSVTVFNKTNRRTTFSCIMVIAEALANVYYWNSVLIKHPEWDIHPRRNVVPDEWALLVISEEELDLLKKLELLAMMTYMEKQ